MKNLLLWLVGATAISLTTVYIFSLTLSADQHPRIIALRLNSHMYELNREWESNDNDLYKEGEEILEVGEEVTEGMETTTLASQSGLQSLQNQESQTSQASHSTQLIQLIQPIQTHQESQTNEITLQNQTAKVPAKRYFGGCAMALKEVIMIVCVGNPIFIGGLVGLMVAFLKSRFAERLGVRV